ncbi:HD-GYP domain-containing protein [Luteimonas vadosa]|uniref:HD-GYP domain-containing protein n=1 Tax=Luteimonas vadosa TaxID=1165507 RepID=A0ABP9E6W1_9GAMM
MDDFTQELRITVQGLEVDMYVARLDRPWLGTDYPLEGFRLTSDADVETLRRLCSHVYVDVSRGASPNPRFVDLGTPDLVREAQSEEEIAALRKTVWEVQTEFDEELADAEAAHESLSESINTVMEDLQAGRQLTIENLRTGVDAMIDSITRNPSAFVWLKAIRRKDDYAYHHALGCSVWAASFGRHLGLDRSELGELALSGLLFDVGKTRLPNRLLSQPAPLDESDSAIMRTHVQHSLDILEGTEGITLRMLEAIATHHERHDGSGYPHGLSGTEIPMFGRILGLIDSYHAMTSVRKFMESRSPHQAVMELYLARGQLYQAELVEQFIQTCGIYPSGSLVELSDGCVGVVTSVHSLRRLRPEVMVLLDAQKKPVANFRKIDLNDMIEDANGVVLSIRRGLPPGAHGIDTAELFLS